MITYGRLVVVGISEGDIISPEDRKTWEKLTILSPREETDVTQDSNRLL